jgi:hypothetical protein
VLAASLTLAAACGDDDMEGSQQGDEPDGEECFNPGGTETGCRCASNRPPGYRQCKRDGIWSQCMCPPAGQERDCHFEGQEVRCHPCRGEDAGRITECLADGTFDCSCRDGGVPNDAG